MVLAWQGLGLTQHVAVLSQAGTDCSKEGRGLQNKPNFHGTYQQLNPVRGSSEVFFLLP